MFYDPLSTHLFGSIRHHPPPPHSSSIAICLGLRVSVPPVAQGPHPDFSNHNSPIPSPLFVGGKAVVSGTAQVPARPIAAKSVVAPSSSPGNVREVAMNWKSPPPPYLWIGTRKPDCHPSTVLNTWQR